MFGQCGVIVQTVCVYLALMLLDLLSAKLFASGEIPVWTQAPGGLKREGNYTSATLSSPVCFYNNIRPGVDHFNV